MIWTIYSCFFFINGQCFVVHALFMNSTLSYHDWYVFFRLLLIYNFTISLISLLNWNISALPNNLQNFFNIQLIGRTEMETMRNSLSWSAIETETDTKFRSIQKSKRNEGNGRKNGLPTRWQFSTNSNLNTWISDANAWIGSDLSANWFCKRSIL